MKKIYLIALSFLALSQANAQLSLTKAANEPAVGDTYETLALDTTNTLPIAVTGTNVEWLFDGVTAQGGTSTFTIGAPSSYSNSANYPGTTMVEEDITNGTKTYYKTIATGYELVGVDAGFFDLNYNSNSLTLASWPITMGYSNNDQGAGAITVNQGTTSLSGSFTSTINTVADGTGLLNINNYAYARNGVLRVKSTQKIEFSILFGTIAGSIENNIYNFYHSSSKYPLLTLNYNYVDATSPQGPLQQLQTTLSVLSDVTVGVKENDAKEVIFKAYPNPANSEVNIHFVLTQNESYTIEVVNMLGQSVKSVNLGDLQPGIYSENININDLTSGVYFIKVNGKTAQGIEKLIVE
jgi:hypothetical protein